MMRVIISSLWFPVSISRYFLSALEHRDDLEVISIGPYTGTWIPWDRGMDLPEKYAVPPTIPLSKNLWTIRSINPKFLNDRKELEDIDIWIQADSNFFFSERPPCKTNVHIAVDPHVLDYSIQRTKTDYFFNMQKTYSIPGDIYLPYCASTYHHYPEEIEKEYDVCLIGLQYTHRNELVAALRREGISVYYGLGLGFDEYRNIYNKARVAISWSSMNDLIARVFEAGAMGIPLVCNRVPDLPLLFTENEHYLGFNSVGEAVSQVKKILDHKDNYKSMAKSFQDEIISKHTYDHRIDQILEMVS
jgi:glycosyltransferase involved in cell wall biosynthesis